jgi:serine/threonine protein kinase
LGHPFHTISSNNVLIKRDVCSLLCFRPAENCRELGPEIVLGGKPDKTLDLWSFGCLVFNITTGSELFGAGGFYGGREVMIDSLLLMLSDILGPLPNNLNSLWTRSSKYNTSKRVQTNTEVCDPFSMKLMPLEKIFDKCKPVDFPDEEAERVTALLRRILQYGPAKRPTPSQLLQDPWFTS